MRFMQLPPVKPGHWLVNVAPLGSKPVWVEQPAPPTADPNDTRLFGYDERAFMAKQYR